MVWRHLNFGVNKVTGCRSRSDFERTCQKNVLSVSFPYSNQARNLLHPSSDLCILVSPSAIQIYLLVSHIQLLQSMSKMSSLGCTETNCKDEFTQMTTWLEASNAKRRSFDMTSSSDGDSMAQFRKYKNGTLQD